MELIRGIHNLRREHQGSVLTIGNFDGVHRGHQVLLKRLVQEGKKQGRASMVMLFEPQPLEVLAGDKAPPRLTRLRDKCHYIAQTGVDYLLCIRFNHQFAACTAEQFISDLLVKQLSVAFLAVGDDFCFGAGRQGDYPLLQRSGKQFGFTVVNSDTLCESGRRVSSTAVRQALQAGELALAESLLGRPYSIAGRVAHGEELGRKLGFPTANLPLKRQKVPVRGVYIVEVAGITRHLLPGVANVGIRPSIGGERQQLEVHLLGRNLNLYGRHIEVILRRKVRDEQRFSSLEALTGQISEDVAMARRYFGLTTT